MINYLKEYPENRAYETPWYGSPVRLRSKQEQVRALEFRIFILTRNKMADNKPGPFKMAEYGITQSY